MPWMNDVKGTTNKDDPLPPRGSPEYLFEQRISFNVLQSQDSMFSIFLTMPKLDNEFNTSRQSRSA